MRLSLALLFVCAACSSPRTARVETVPSRGEVYLDGRSAGFAPLDVDLPAAADGVVVADSEDHPPLSFRARHDADLRFDLGERLFLESIGSSWEPTQEKRARELATAVELAFYGGAGGGSIQSEIDVGLFDVSDTESLAGTWVAGGRFTAWLTRGEWGELGIAVDGSYTGFDDDDEGFSLGSTWITPMFIARTPIDPGGIVRLYGGFGPTFVTTRAEVETGFLLLGDIESTETDVGIDGRAGVFFRITDHIGLFAEYRGTRVVQEFEDFEVSVETTRSQHLGMAGIAVGF